VRSKLQKKEFCKKTFSEFVWIRIAQMTFFILGSASKLGCRRGIS